MRDLQKVVHNHCFIDVTFKSHRVGSTLNFRLNPILRQEIGPGHNICA